MLERLAKSARTTPEIVGMDWHVVPPPEHVRRFEKLVRDKVSETERALRRVPVGELGGDEHLYYWLEPLISDAMDLAVMAEEAGLSWCAPGIDPFEFVTGSDWLERILGTASIVGDLLIQPPPGSRFTDPLVEILLTVNDRAAFGWVGSRGHGLAVGFDRLALHKGDQPRPLGRVDEPAFGTAFGILVAWYLDRCMPRRSQSAQTVPQLQLAERWSWGETWFPSPAFEVQVSSVRSSPRRGAYAHWVIPHVRTLTAAEPDPGHVADAPEHLRPLMGPSETWVHAHQRHRAHRQLALVRFETHSALADAIGSARPKR